MWDLRLRKYIPNSRNKVAPRHSAALGFLAIHYPCELSLENRNLLNVLAEGYVGESRVIGDALPIFFDDRVFALIDYELIEAAGSPVTITKISRVDALRLLRDGRMAAARLLPASNLKGKRRILGGSTEC